jgi:hypothetical protein
MLKNLFIRENLKWKEVKKMKKLIFVMLLSLILFGIGTAQADFWTGSVWNNDTDAFVPNVMGFDWSSSGSGVAIGLGPFGTPFPDNTPFTFLYQAALVGLTDPIGQPIAFPGLNTTFEYTVAAIIPETGRLIDLGGGLIQGVFTTQLGGIWAIFNDEPDDAVVASGDGFVDGTLVASGTINPGQISTFLANTNTGDGIGSAILEGLVDFADPAFLDIASIILDFRFEGTLNYPPLDSTTTCFFCPGGYVIQPNDLPLKVDGSSKFSVPEPSTLLLLGSGLLGLGAYARRRIKK